MKDNKTSLLDKLIITKNNKKLLIIKHNKISLANISIIVKKIKIL